MHFAFASGAAAAHHGETGSTSVSPTAQSAPQASQPKAQRVEMRHKSASSAAGSPPGDLTTISALAKRHQVTAAKVLQSEGSSKPSAEGNLASVSVPAVKQAGTSRYDRSPAYI